MPLPALLFALAAVDMVVVFLVAPSVSGPAFLLAFPVLGPLAIGLLALRQRPGQAAPPAALPEAPAHKALPEAMPPSAAGLRLLSALQEEARLVDFVTEEISGYSDQQVGAAARGIHASLRKALGARMALEPVLPGEEGDRVEVPAGFDPAAIRIVGTPSGKPPYRGVLRHAGWRARDARLPVPVAGTDASVLAPAEVEVS